jgi:hypothetical protein
MTIIEYTFTNLDGIAYYTAMLCCVCVYVVHMCGHTCGLPLTKTWDRVMYVCVCVCVRACVCVSAPASEEE